MTLYRKEFLFLCDVFQKSRINARAVRLEDFGSFLEKELFTVGNGGTFSAFNTVFEIQEQTIYRLSDLLGCKYRFLLLSDSKTVLYIGPYLSRSVSAEELLEIGEERVLSAAQQRHLAEYYAGLPIVGEDSSLWIMLNTFCETVWKTTSFSIHDILQNASIAASAFVDITSSVCANDMLVKIKHMEQRYAFENELIRAVELGQIHKENQLITGLSTDMFEKRITDSLRNIKNYGIIMNTLLRKAAERGGVHPIHLDRVSSEFAKKIEQMTSVSQYSELMSEMFRSYCRLVRQYSIQGFSPVVQRAILLIDADLSAEHSPKKLAESQGISLGYLSAVFKKETGKTISEHLTNRRIENAVHLLQKTNLQIQTIALHCGIMDIQYFSKLFKKKMGVSPSEYRSSWKSGTVVF